ncbi:hypothetical protein BAUCODRAFT_410862 [Baudoinia panamericana UAMH 10762]|uniref:EGF-like domain-containing protein n=1 Tax=Baudoinia panamericana (strain UAMH 10762) TaxID=717646 RepID=M2NGC2_BAUPA|nr:uncharacterized protein BAUCODRAFT_410862 [Baudoinia panamericana UAMH 10762]EMC98020.1 hypothetical protein BAUCODRAFT_410862 [Baudoinia panamericana UAMH 10762]
MNYQHYDQGGHYGIPSYPSQPARNQRDSLPSQGRRTPLAHYADAPSQRGPRGMMPVQPAQRQSAPYRPTENLYDGSAYGGPEYVDQVDWPLPAAPRPYAQSPRSGSPTGSAGGRRPPPRPQRPDYQPPPPNPPRQSRVSPSNQQYRPGPALPSQQVYHEPPQWTGDGYTSPSAGYPPPQPQHIYQQGAYIQANKRPPLGPPPTSRRGHPSYYPHVGPVHPIAEETDSMYGSTRGHSMVGNHDSMKSNASSNAIPIGIPDYYLQETESVTSQPGAERPFSSEHEYEDESPIDPSPTSGKDSRISQGTESSGISSTPPSPEPAPLVRQASLGRKSKPTLTTVRSAERMRKGSLGDGGLASLPSQQKGATSVTAPTMPFAASNAGPAPEPAVPYLKARERDVSGSVMSNAPPNVPAAGDVAALAAPRFFSANRSGDNLSHRTTSSEALGSGAGLLYPSSSESEREVKKNPPKERVGESGNVQQAFRERSPLANEVDPRETILAGLEGGGALPSSAAAAVRESDQLPKPSAGFSERAGKRRPPRLNVDVVREAEARGSLTSLSDLIKRATRLASNLDRGKTASRLGAGWISDEADASDNEKFGAKLNNRGSGSISDILANFPPPGLSTPPRSRGNDGDDARSGSITNWSSKLKRSHLPSDSDPGADSRERRRRCCGMPLWLFLLLLIALILLIAAAIIVPVVLIVIPRQNQTANSSTNTAIKTCQSQLTCQNGGANVITSMGVCQCVCVNGYTGSTCNTQSGAGCTSMTVGSMTDATIGNAIPRLLAGAEGNFSVPLNAQTLLGLFSGADLSCQSENALVTFDNSAGVKRDSSPTPTLNNRQAATSNGITYDTGAPPSPTNSSSSALTPSATASANSTSTLTQEDFARVAVLYVFQASGQLNDAVVAQENLQTYFKNAESGSGQTAAANNITLGNGFLCSLSGFNIKLSNGTTVGRS